MSWSRAGLNFTFLLILFILQESAVSKVNLPIAGFSLYLAALLGMMALEDNFGAVPLGFIGGLILDLSPSADSPLGKWALILTVIGYLIASNRESVGDFTQRPAAFIVFIALASIVTLLSFLSLGVILGENNGTLTNNLVKVLGNGFWTLLFSPLLIPTLGWWRSVSLTSRERA